MELSIVKNYKEQMLYKTSDYERMLKFEVDLKSIDESRENLNSFYYMDNREGFWLEVDFIKTLKIELPFTQIFRHLKTIEFAEIYAVCIPKSEIQTIIDLVSDKYLCSVLHIIFSNNRQGAPRKNIIFDNKIYNIQLQADMETAKTWKIIQ